ncbi:polysaccharide pyruvyl transferase family protein [Blastopirellula sp. JC732]|uniref:Polysaccharide pyruvyl transferase family protein n=1 Tax=Blastopirellula sediminis TaxID=2894196 RepID=A0A9X1SFN2_9BACT|nr:polysaccharide pyruvyl transferase family protein [Blastopirellula sediminis]MCC9607312.1 polysaccharide pyruvyl transferase family protein [Blastopirellula sediminis]MCC9629395.1 polysaccharide pyruvyl transferase family protein [Blastopirellula sediminis]
MPNISRRACLAQLAALSTLPLVTSALAAKEVSDVRCTVLLRSGWQTVNIGDIAHTPGVLQLFRDYLPNVEVILWSNALDRGVREMLLANFPNLKIVSGNVSSDGKFTTPELQQAFDEADFLLHGSGPSVVAASHVAAWRKATGKPYGILGVTISAAGEAASGKLSPQLEDLLSGADFVFTREKNSLQNVQDAGVTGPVLGFAPDGTFHLKLKEKEGIKQFMEENELEPRKFIVCVPRLRYTPYHKIRKTGQSEQEIARREAVNEAHAEEDHAKLRAAIVAWVRKTGGKAVLCPEMTYQVEIMRPLLFDPLPEDVKKNVVLHEKYWITDDASTLYADAAAVISCECHSPIIAASVGTPCMYLHQPEDGIKGNMWRDVGLGAWYFPIEETTGDDVAAAVVAIADDFPAAKKRIDDAVAGIETNYAANFEIIAESLKKASKSK